VQNHTVYPKSDKVSLASWADTPNGLRWTWISRDTVEGRLSLLSPRNPRCVGYG
jgi:hypothetical protein